uniref:Uncharacterized protein n=1 Tax=Aegilops tauschii subsp. strangulata TaxID=200361 RepID=A0A453QFT9_AEGTS
MIEQIWSIAHPLIDDSVCVQRQEFVLVICIIRSQLLMLSPGNKFRYKQCHQLASSVVISPFLTASKPAIYTGVDWADGDQLKEAIDGQLVLSSNSS